MKSVDTVFQITALCSGPDRILEGMLWRLFASERSPSYRGREAQHQSQAPHSWHCRTVARVEGKLQCTGPTGTFVGKPLIDQMGHICSAISIPIVKWPASEVAELLAGVK